MSKHLIPFSRDEIKVDDKIVIHLTNEITARVTGINRSKQILMITFSKTLPYWNQELNLDLYPFYNDAIKIDRTLSLVNRLGAKCNLLIKGMNWTKNIRIALAWFNILLGIESFIEGTMNYITTGDYHSTVIEYLMGIVSIVIGFWGLKFSTEQKIPEPYPYFDCPVCRMKSYSDMDIQEKYCGNCHSFMNYDARDERNNGKTGGGVCPTESKGHNK